MQKHPTLSSYHFKRAKTDGLIEVLNEGSYVMAEYSERTGILKWQRVVMTSQREKIEKWLREHYPVQKTAPPPAPARKLAKSASNRA
ncbi:MAG TPA: hypothetical protein VKX49_21255 [Bryobacteraceae bacterium]|nr:hypothetical protein [Bryobacteraceae bacterium]